MDLFDTACVELVEALNRNRVEYMLVGGMATNLHGYSRGTADMDICIRPTTENALRLAKALNECQLGLEELETFAPLVPEKGLWFRIVEPPFILDVMSEMNGVDFEAAFARRRFYDLDGLEVFVIHRNDLIANKMTTGRSQDAADVENLHGVEPYFRGKKLEYYEKPPPPPDPA